MEKLFTAGVAQVDITPALGTLINGEFVTYYAHHIHDPLYSKALVLSDGITTLAIVMVDICAMDMEFINEVKLAIEKGSGIPAGNILIASTHTHYAGAIVDLLGGPCDLGYRKQLAGKIVESVIQATSRLRPAKICHVSVPVPEHVVCRRYYMKPGYEAKNPVTGGNDLVKTNPAGAEHLIDRRASKVDTELSAIGIMSTGGEWISVLANYSMHYVGDCPNGTITADYFGVFARHIANQLNAGNRFVAMLSNGTSGEANIWDFFLPDRYPKEDYQKSELIGADLAKKIAEKIINVQWNKTPVLSASYECVVAALRKPSADELEAAKKIVTETDYRLLNPDQEAMVKIYAREQILLNEFPDTIELPVQILKIGDVLIGGLGGEFFAETGLKLKQAINTGKYFTITLANDCVGYVPPAHEIEKGGYETWRCRSSKLEKKTEKDITNKMLELVKKIRLK